MGKKLMFVDDDEAFLQFVRHACASLPGIESTLQAADGVDALNVLGGILRDGDRLPDVIAVDINMPRMDGFAFLEAFAALRKQHAELTKVRPVAMLTSSDQARDRDRARTLGADHYILKPATLAEAKKTLAKFAE